MVADTAVDIFTGWLWALVRVVLFAVDVFFIEDVELW